MVGDDHTSLGRWHVDQPPPPLTPALIPALAEAGRVATDRPLADKGGGGQGERRAHIR